MSLIIGGGGLSSSSLYSLPSWQSSSSSDAANDLSTGLPSGMPDWSDTTSSAGDVISVFSDSISDFADSLSTVTTNELSGMVNNAADAAAKRLGISLPSSSSSSTSSSSSRSSSTSSTSKTTSSSGQNIAATDIDGFLAKLDGNAPAATSSSSTPFNFESFLNNLNNIASGVSTSNAPTTPTGKNFSIDSYLQTLDSIAAKPKPTVNVTT